MFAFAIFDMPKHPQARPSGLFCSDRHMLGNRLKSSGHHPDLAAPPPPRADIALSDARPLEGRAIAGASA